MSEPTSPDRPTPGTGPLGSEAVPSADDHAAGPVWPPEETEPDAGHGEDPGQGRGLVEKLRHPRRS